MSTENFAETLRQILDSHSQEVRVCFFARITRVNRVPGSPTVDIQPVVKEPLTSAEGERTSERPPIIQGVPLLFLQGGAFWISFPIEVGGTVLVLVSSQDFSNWYLNASEGEPLFSRVHSLANSVALPLGFSRGNGATIPSSDLVVNASSIKLGSAGATLHAAIAEQVKAEIQAVIGAFNTHIHPTPAGNSSVPTVVMSDAGDVHSNAVKVDS